MRCSSVTVWGLCAAATLWGAPAMAGPWAREAGDLFISLQISVEEEPAHLMEGLWEPETYTSLYAEYGFGRSFTIGADLGGGEVSQMGVAFLRYTLTPPDATWQWAVDAGLGARRIDDGPVHGLVRFGASVGRGFGESDGAWPIPIRHEGGWVALDTALIYDVELEDVIWQAEGTLGFSLSDRATAIVSLKAEEWPGADMIVTVSPSFAFDILPDTTVRLGARGALEGSTNVGLFLSLWHTF
ncbi:hypothetical protein [Gymnodinialimonas hymeniacidonis]|uniref:hypothetical protein n=1 Tax=Gymnodinialimonas hymeniacidonis TaxID=3126508 RepID=UPI0034C64846